MDTLRHVTGPVEEVLPSILHHGMDLVMVLDRGRTINDDNLVSVRVPSGTLSVADVVTVRIKNGTSSLFETKQPAP